MIRTAAVSGLFYPSHPKQLAGTVESLLRSRACKQQKKALGLVVPHAGYEYSGATAAAAYAAIPTEQLSTIVIVSPSHREYFDGISIYQGEAYETPLGALRVNAALRSEVIAKSEYISASTEGHGNEHAIEVQLPFIQHIAPEAMILPIVVGNQNPEYIRALGLALAETVSFDDMLIVASSDLSHFHSLSDAEKLDAVARDAIERLDPDLLLHHLDNGSTEACGGGPIAAMLYAVLAHGATRCAILDQTTSAEVTRDTSNVVGYLSAAVYKN